MMFRSVCHSPNRPDSLVLTPFTVPGWDQLEQKANDNWGDGSRKIVTNDEDVSVSHAILSITFLLNPC